MAILSVSQLNRYVGFKLKEDRALQGILVRGEITNFTNHYRSGHLYFTLRDAESCVKAVMFREQCPASAVHAPGRDECDRSSDGIAL